MHRDILSWIKTSYVVGVDSLFLQWKEVNNDLLLGSRRIGSFQYLVHSDIYNKDYRVSDKRKMSPFSLTLGLHFRNAYMC